MDGAEPDISTGEKFGIFPASFFLCYIGCYIRSDHIIVHQAHRWLVDEYRIIPRFRPCAAGIPASACRRGEHPNPVDLQVRLSRGMNQWSNFLMIGQDGAGPDISD